MNYLFVLLSLISSSSVLAKMGVRDIQQERGLAASTTTTLGTSTVSGISTISGSTTTTSSTTFVTASPSSSGSPASTLGCVGPPPATTANPVSIAVPSGRGISLQGSTNAALLQRVIISLSSTGSGGSALPASIIFAGLGELNTPMQVSPRTSPPTTCGTFPVQGNNITVTLLFQNINGSRVSNSTLQAFTGSNVFDFHAEDAGDCDFNDTLFTMAFQPGGSIGC
ncbi:hypothetical protein B0H34DRAFT_292181 [Crassisporium funariophilum]|nr:hypothetical protein B0H34DRAFT_292181 [Crassisporium funariophilum]